MTSVREFFRRGDPAIWFAGSGLGICLLMITGMIGIILVNGLGFFWPGTLSKLTLRNGEVTMGEVVIREAIPQPGKPTEKKYRIQVKVGNRDVSGVDFRWIDESAITRREEPKDALYIERREYGPFIGTVTKLMKDDQVVASGSDATWTALQPLIGWSVTRSAASTMRWSRCGCVSGSWSSSASKAPATTRSSARR
jgi:phosphate transport system permease protein